MRWVLLAGALFIYGCGTVPREAALLQPYPGARVLQRVTIPDGYGLLFVYQQGLARYVGVAATLKIKDGAYETEVKTRLVERMPGLDTPLVFRAGGETGPLLLVAGLATHPEAARVEVTINGGTPIGAEVKEGGYVLSIPPADVKQIQVQLLDKMGRLIDRWPPNPVPVVWHPQGGEVS